MSAGPCNCKFTDQSEFSLWKKSRPLVPKFSSLFITKRKICYSVVIMWHMEKEQRHTKQQINVELLCQCWQWFFLSVVLFSWSCFSSRNGSKILLGLIPQALFLKWETRIYSFVFYLLCILFPQPLFIPRLSISFTLKTSFGEYVYAMDRAYVIYTTSHDFLFLWTHISFKEPFKTYSNNSWLSSKNTGADRVTKSSLGENFLQWNIFEKY